jgi:beta-catenin-like protein 1
MKHAADPEKFVESELDLDDGIRKLHALATAPALYPELVRLTLLRPPCAPLRVRSAPW